MHQLTVCAIHRGEDEHLLEWIEYHRLVGVEFFFLINNNDNVASSRKILQPYIDAGTVRDDHWPGRYRQLDAYTALIGANVGKTVWAAFIDLDEFIYPIVADTITELLPEFDKPNYGGLVLHWYMFSESDTVQRPRFVTQTNLHRSGGDALLKTIIRPERAHTWPNPHVPVFRSGFSCVDECHSGTISPLKTPPTGQRLRINHYWIRSHEDLASKLVRGRADSAVAYSQAHIDAVRCNAVVYDDSLWRRFGAALEASPAGRRDA
jgi:hypothetical protein